MSSKELVFKMPKNRSYEKEAQYRRLRKVMSNADAKALLVNIPAPLHNQFKTLCAKRNLKIKDVILGAIVNFLKEGEI